MPSPVIVVTSSLLFVVVVAEVIPVATETTPVPAVAPVAREIVGCAVTFTPVKQLDVVGVPSAVIAVAESPTVTPVTSAAPVPEAVALPVATVIAVPRVTLDAVTSLPLPPEIINVSAASPDPIAKSQFDLLAVTVVLPVTLGTVVVTSLFPCVTDTDLTKVSVLCAPKPVMAAAVPLAPTAVPDAVALTLVVVGVTVVVKVAPLPRTLSVVGLE